MVGYLFVVVLFGAVGPSIGHKHSTPLDSFRYDRATVQLQGEVKISVTPQVLEVSGEYVVVSWAYVNNPSATDWIGAYAPPLNDVYRIDPSKHAPLKYQFANYSSTHLSYGEGAFKFRMVNVRQRIIFGFFTGGFDYPILLATSNIIRFQNPYEPLQAHLALTGDPTEMMLMWISKNASLPVVYWGENSGKYYYARSADSSTYTADDMCGSPATDVGYMTPGIINYVKMTNLVPGTRYYYTYGDLYGWSEELSFVSAPSAGSSDNITVIAYGDMGCGELDDSMMMYTEQPSLNTTNHILEQLDDIDIVMHIGDMSYARGYSSVKIPRDCVVIVGKHVSAIEEQWDVFFDQIEPIASRVPYMVCIGNHERNWPDSSPGYYNNSDSGGECGVPHEMRFPMPRPSLDQPWYGFDYASVHFVLMSTEHDFRPGSRQYRWISNHLKYSVDRSVTPWLIFSGHRPMYVDSNDDAYPDGHLAVAELLRESLEYLLKEFEVDLALWAHHHSYQRTCPVYQEVCTDGATTHIVIGMGGRDISYDLIAEETPDWIEYMDYEHYGYSRFTVNATTLVFEYVRNEDNQVHDSVVLQK